jgi:hypothetical protein
MTPYAQLTIAQARRVFRRWRTDPWLYVYAFERGKMRRERVTA